MRTKRHMSVNIGGMLKHYKNKSMAGLIQEDDGTPLTHQQVVVHLHNLQIQGHKKMCCSSECEGFDPFDKGCPGHPIDDDTAHELNKEAIASKEADNQIVEQFKTIQSCT